MDKVAIIIQARSGSTRLRRKIFADLGGKPLLWHVIERAKQSTLASTIVVATTSSTEDQEILELAKACGVKGFAGPKDDVLRRYVEAAQAYHAEIVVRMTGDCPLIHPPTLDAMIALLQDYQADYVCPDPRRRSLETGLEVLTMEALCLIDEKAKKEYQREHVTLYLREHPAQFRIALYTPDPLFQRTDIRLTVDYPEDRQLMQSIYQALYRQDEIVDLREVVSFLDQNQELKCLNTNAELSAANQLSISAEVSKKLIRAAVNAST